MRAARTMTTVAVAAAALLPLSACSLTTSASTQPAATHVRSAAPARSSAAHSPTQPTEASSPATASSASSPSAPRSTAAPTPTPTVTITPSAAPSAHVLDYGDDGVAVRLPVKADAVPGSPSGFIDGARAELTKQWARYGNQAGCEQVPVLWVEKISTAGFAAAAYNDDPSQANGSQCQNVGGGAQEFWAVVGGTWQPVIVTQDVPTCAQFEKYSFPSSIVGKKCYDGNKLVSYSHS